MSRRIDDEKMAPSSLVQAGMSPENDPSIVLGLTVVGGVTLENTIYNRRIYDAEACGQ